MSEEKWHTITCKGCGVKTVVNKETKTKTCFLCGGTMK